MISSSSKMNIGGDRRNRGNNKIMKVDFIPLVPQKAAIKEKNLMHASNKKIFIGPNYQAELPSLLNSSAQETYENIAKSPETLLWIPTDKVSDEKLTALVSELKPKGFDEDQILPFLRYQNYDIDATLSVLNSEYVGKQEGMPLHDKVLFMQGYGFHGKNFERIHDLVPNHSIQTLISYYYTEFKRMKSNKLNATRPESEVRKLSNVANLMEAVRNDRTSGLDAKRPIGRPRREAIATATVDDVIDPTVLLPLKSSLEVDGEESREEEIEHVREQGWVELGKQQDLQVAAERERLGQLMKDDEVAEELKKLPLDLSGEMVEEDVDVKEAKKVDQKDPTPLWMQDEIMVFMRSLVEFGTDFGQCARLLPNKTEQQVRNFYYNRNHFYGLDKLVTFHEEKMAAKEKTRAT